MASEAQRRASRKYRKRMWDSGKIKRIAVEFGKSEIELYEWVQEHKPVATYIKQLIREDMK